MCTRNLITKFAVVVTGILVSLDLFAQDDLAPAYVEWERIAQPTAVPTIPGVMLALLGLALLAYGTHRIWRQRNTSVRLLAIVAMTGGALLFVQGAPQLVGLANATIPLIILDESPKALDFGDNAIQNGQSFAVRITALRDGVGEVDQGLADTPKCQVGMVLAPDEVCHAYVEELLLIIYVDAITSWDVFDCCGGSSIAEIDLGGNNVLEFTYDGDPGTNTVTFFQPPAPVDLLGFAGGTVEFDLFVVSQPTNPAANPWLIKIDCDSGCSTGDTPITQSVEGVLPATGAWQHYTFNLDDLVGQGLDLSEASALVIFPTWGNQDNAIFRLDNVVFIKSDGGD